MMYSLYFLSNLQITFLIILIILRLSTTELEQKQSQVASIDYLQGVIDSTLDGGITI